jgi:hypothetical protein
MLARSSVAGWQRIELAAKTNCIAFSSSSFVIFHPTAWGVSKDESSLTKTSVDRKEEAI